jgi:anti-sigma regulatory factor (Ser/Thr protein kinase)
VSVVHGADVERFEVARPLDLQLAVLRTQRSALLRGASDLDRSVVATIVSELGSNVLKYAGRGTVELRRLRPLEGPGVEVVVRDQGPGIPDLALALTDHYSSGRTLGLGLPGVKRMADAFHVEPSGGEAGTGTTVRVRKRWAAPLGDVALPPLEGPVRPLVGAGTRWSAAARVRARHGHPHAGDLAAIVDRGDRIAFGIVDATGHGAVAHALAHALVHRLHEHFATAADPDDVAALLQQLHERCAGTPGAAAGVAVLDPAAGTFRYLAVGNVRAAVVGARRFTGVSRDAGPPPSRSAPRSSPTTCCCCGPTGSPARSRTRWRRRRPAAPPAASNPPTWRSTC